MKRFRLRSLLALLACLCLVAGLGGASASGLDASLSRWLSQEGALRFSGTLELNSFLPFPQEKLPLFNALLKHISFQASLEEDGDGSLTTLQLLCGGTDVLTLIQRQQGGSSSLQTNLLPARTLTSQGGSPIALLPGRQEEEPAFDFLAAISQAEESYKALIAACEPFAEKKKANYKIKDIGSSKWSQIARLTTEQSDGMLPLLRAVLQSGMDEAYRQELEGVRFGKGFIVGLYKEGESGRDLAVYMKGDLLYPDGSKYKLSYQWGFLNQGTERKDTYKYEAVKSGSPADRRLVAAKASQKLYSTEISLTGSSETTLRQDKATTTQEFKFDLSGKDSGQDRSLSGSWSQETRRAEEGEAVSSLQTFIPALFLRPEGDGAVLSGTVQVEEKKGKTVTSSLTLTFGEEIPAAFTALAQDSGLYAVDEPASAPPAATPLPASSMEQNADLDPALQEPEGSSAPEDYLVGAPPIGLKTYPVPSQMTEVSLDSLSDEALGELMAELSQNLAGKLLAAFSQLPVDDIALLTDGLTQEDAASFLSLFSGL
ncbi:MAG: hypothetical protein VB099_14860 [Candidatus Limiplasma sp.]|nr:hypothetical protein [Candidatus Limiplasma sp.]